MSLPTIERGAIKRFIGKWWVWAIIAAVVVLLIFIIFGQAVDRPELVK